MTERKEEWAPRKRLRHLHSIQARNLTESILDGAPLQAYFALWSHVKAAKEQHQAALVYISEQVEIGVAPEWQSFDFSSLAADPGRLHGLLSGLLHVHVYAAPAGSFLPNLPRTTGPPHPSLQTLKVRANPALSPLHQGEADFPAASAVAAGEESQVEAANSNFAESNAGSAAGNLEHIAEDSSSDQAEPDAAHFVSFQQFFPTVKPEVVRMQLSRASGPDTLLPHLEQMKDSELCCGISLPGDLLLAVSVDLEVLDCLGGDLRALDDGDDKPRLVFGLKDGSYRVWPPMPKGWTPVEPISAGQADDDILYPSEAIEQAEERSRRWGLFRRTTLENTAHLLEKDSTEASSSASNLAEGRVLSLPNFASTSSSLDLFSSNASGPMAYRQGAPCQVSWGEMEAGIRSLEAVQQEKHAFLERGGRSLQKLNLALKAREEVRQQQSELEHVRHEVAVCREHARRCRQRMKSVKSSSSQARSLMQGLASQLSVALCKLEALWAHKDGPEASHWCALSLDWRSLHRKLVARRCRLASDVQHVFGIQPRTVSVVEAPQRGFLWHQLDYAWAEVPVRRSQKAISAAQNPQEASSCAASSGGSSLGGESLSTLGQTASELSNAGSQIREVARLAISSLDLESSFVRQNSENLAALGRESDKVEAMRLAAALGYAAHVTHALADYLGVPLKYPIRPSNSRSAVEGHQRPDILHCQRAQETKPEAPHFLEEPPPEYLLFPGGAEQALFLYAIFLLNKDVEQLLNAHGLTSVGPSHVLQNLYKLLSAAASVGPPKAEWQ